MANYGPTATLFTLSRSHIVQQFDMAPNSVAMQVASVQHVPANTPPTPPTTLDEGKGFYNGSESTNSDAPILPTISNTEESSADEAAYLSPIQKIAQEMESLESEIRDKVMPLSPTSSRASSASSRSSGARRRGRKYLYDRPNSSQASSHSGYEPTEFSLGTVSTRPKHESISIRSVSSFASASNPRYRPTTLRKEIMRSPQETHDTAAMELFPNTKSRLRGVPFRTPHYGDLARTPDLLQREMLSVVFGWDDTAEALVREEMESHRPGSASAVLLSKWLGDIGGDAMASMVGSESMTSSDWMLLALSSIGADSQKKVGEAFVQRLLEKGDVHPAVAILIGLGEHNDAIEVYVSQQCWVEAVLLTCLTCPADWGRISYLIRKWGEAAVLKGRAELAVRCFSCTSIETSEPWFSPRAQDAVYAAQQQRLTQPPSGATSPQASPPSRSASGRLTAKNASLKLITTFGDKGIPVGTEAATPLGGVGVTPIAQSAMPSALSPTVADASWQQRPRTVRDPSSARTATPGGFSRRKRLPSRTDIERAKQEAATLATPITASRDYVPPMPAGHSRRTSSVGSSQGPTTAMKSAVQVDRLAPESALRSESYLPSPAQGVFTRLKETQARHGSTERKPEGLAVHVVETRYTDNLSPGPGTGGSSRPGALSPPLTDGSMRSAKGRAINEYISSVEEARDNAREKRTRSRPRGDSQKRENSRPGRGTSRPREPSETRGRHNVRYIKPAKRSPSSPVPMSPEEIALASNASKVEPATTDDESFYKLASPVDSHKSMRSARSEPKPERRRPSLASATEGAPPVPVAVAKPVSRGASRHRSPDRERLQADNFRGRPEQRVLGSAARSPSSPLPMSSDQQNNPELDETNSDGRRVRLRAGSRSEEASTSRRAGSRGNGSRSTSRKPVLENESSLGMPVSQFTDSSLGLPTSQISKSSLTDASQLSSVSGSSSLYPRSLSRKELAARELEERRLSLARRPSAPSIPLPSDLQISNRPGIGGRSLTELGNSPTSFSPPFSRSQTVDPDAMAKYNRMTAVSTPTQPIGLPATPRAMRHPRYMGTDFKGDNTPPVPEIPDNASQLSSIGSNLSQMTGSNVESNLTSNLTSHLTSNISQVASNISQVTSNSSQVTSNMSQLTSSEVDDGVAPLLPSTVFGQKGGPNRSASAPPDHISGGLPVYMQGLSGTARRLSHMRKISPPDAAQMAKSPIASVSSIDEALAGADQIIIVPEGFEEPPVLPELQHLNGPPPPPPPPTMYSQPGQTRGSGVISIAIDDNPTPGADNYPQPMERATTTSPQSHRRGRGSVSETFGSRFRGFGDRMRSTSRNRTKSPQDYKPSPYETVLPPFPYQHQRGDSVGTRAKSPYEQAMADQLPPPPPPPPQAPLSAVDGRINEFTIPPSQLPRSASASGGYRHPKEIRANYPPDTLQSGASGGFL